MLSSFCVFPPLYSDAFLISLNAKAMVESLSKVYSPSPDAMYQLLGGEAVLLNMKTEQYFGLDSVGTRVWEVVAQTGTLELIVATLIAEYEVDEAVLRRDIEALLAELVQAKLVVAVDAP
jgi:hypothetical protein